MKMCRTAFLCAIYLCVSAQGEPQCSCYNGCGNNGTTFPGSNGNIVNVAYGKPANMSSTFPSDGASGPACVAVNGRTDTVFTPQTDPNTNCVHTDKDDYDAFWLVDLGRNYTVTDITVYRRQDNFEDNFSAIRMSGMSVYVDSQLCYSFLNFTSANMAELRALTKQINITCSTPLTGRHVRFQKHGEERKFNPGAYFITICEVQVWACKDGLFGAQCDQTCSGHCKDNDTCDNYYGTCPSGQSQICSAPCTAWCGNERLSFPGSNGRIVNVAFGKPASASSGYNDSNGPSAPACIAVNGRTSTIHRSTTQPNTNCIHTDRDDFNASWSVDLIRNYIVTNITIYRRQGGQLGRRMAGLSVLVDGQLCYSFPDSSDIAALDKLPARIDLTCTPPLTGRVVKLQKHGLDTDGQFYFINICEVQIWGCADGIFGSGCSQRCGQCVNSSVCRHDNGFCEQGCSDGYGGILCDTRCADGIFGSGCSQRCGQCVNSSVCRHDNGFCEQGCSDGYGGILCDTKYASSEDSQNLAGPIAGAVFGGLCVIALSILIVGIYRRRSQQRPQSAQAVAMQGAAIQSGGSDNLAVISHQMTPSAEAANNNVTVEENHYYDELQTPDDSDRAPYSSPVFVNGNENTNNPHIYANAST